MNSAIKHNILLFKNESYDLQRKSPLNYISSVFNKKRDVLIFLNCLKLILGLRGDCLIPVLLTGTVE